MDEPVHPRLALPRVFAVPVGGTGVKRHRRESDGEPRAERRPETARRREDRRIGRPGRTGRCARFAHERRVARTKMLDSELRRPNSDYLKASGMSGKALGKRALGEPGIVADLAIAFDSRIHAGRTSGEGIVDARIFPASVCRR